MKIDTTKPIILSIGGSLIVPDDGIDTTFLTNLEQFIRKHAKNGLRFFLVAGGGSTARHYIDAARQILKNVTKTDLDWLGIHTTHLNAQLLQTIFTDIAHPRIIENYDKKLENWHEPIAIGAGWKPGWSTDYDAVVLARDYDAKIIINLSNIDFVYDKNPHTHPEAKPLEKINWSQMEELVGEEWTPGKNVPFDPMATKLAREIGATVIITNGADLDNASNIIEDKIYKGTTITP